MDLPEVRVPCLRLSRGLRVVIGLFFFLAGKDAHNGVTMKSVSAVQI